MSRYAIENFRPTQADVELLAISGKAEDMPVGRLLRRRRSGDEWRVPEMPPFRNLAGQEHPDREWVRRNGDSYAAFVVLTPAGLELLAEELIREAARSTFSLQFQVGRRELDDLYHAEFRLGRALDALEALGSPRWRELADSYAHEAEKARREGTEDASKGERCLGEGQVPVFEDRDGLRAPTGYRTCDCMVEE